MGNKIKNKNGQLLPPYSMCGLTLILGGIKKPKNGNFSVKLASDYLAEPLHHVISLSIMQQKFPSCWKLTKIVPLHKKQSTLKPENYRPVAILSPLSKVLEKDLSLFFPEQDIPPCLAWIQRGQVHHNSLVNYV